MTKEKDEVIRALAASLTLGRGKQTRSVRVVHATVSVTPAWGLGATRWSGDTLVVAYKPVLSFKTVSGAYECLRTVAFTAGSRLVVAHAILCGRSTYHAAERAIVIVDLNDPKSLDVVAKRLEKWLGVIMTA